MWTSCFFISNDACGSNLSKSYFPSNTKSFTLFDTLNFTTVFAAILIFSPVFGW
jgi:hypothetical protein